MKDKPINEVRLGAIKAAVWKNETSSGARFKVQFSRIFKDGDRWKSTDSFGRDDLLLVAKIADQAHSWIHEQEQKKLVSQPSPAKTAKLPQAEPSESQTDFPLALAAVSK